MSVLVFPDRLTACTCHRSDVGRCSFDLLGDRMASIASRHARRPYTCRTHVSQSEATLSACEVVSKGLKMQVRKTQVPRGVEYASTENVKSDLEAFTL